MLFVQVSNFQKNFKKYNKNIKKKKITPLSPYSQKDIDIQNELRGRVGDHQVEKSSEYIFLLISIFFSF